MATSDDDDYEYEYSDDEGYMSDDASMEYLTAEAAGNPNAAPTLSSGT
jgi:hypothetical protein